LSDAYRIGVIADTHGTLFPRVLELFDGVDLILHAGDIGRDEILIELETIATVKAVVGNTDATPVASALPETLKLKTPAGRIAMTHGHLSRAAAYHPETLPIFFAEFKPEIIIFGHTHVPMLTKRDGVILFNPGAAGRSRVGGRGPMVGLISVESRDVEPKIEHLLLNS
jgi:uncharacterized protein